MLTKLFKNIILISSNLKFQIRCSEKPLRSFLTVARCFRHNNLEPVSSDNQSKTELPKDNLKDELIKYTAEDFKFIEQDVKKELDTVEKELKEASQYHFDGKGKYIRPMIAMLMARACNYNHDEIFQGQKEVAVISEMIHTASLIHDDVVDASNLRRGKHTAHYLWGQKKTVLAGDYIIASASKKMARLGNTEVTKLFSIIILNLVEGELMQLGSKESESERFNHYMKKTYMKTASLIANSCKAVAILSDGGSKTMQDIAYEYGKNVGIAFQLIDDYLDFTASETSMGKPVCADLQLGLATAPVLYASEQFPELNALIMRRFSNPGDVEMAREMVSKSKGKEHTMFLARQHCNEAIKQVNKLDESRARKTLINLTQKILNI